MDYDYPIDDLFPNSERLIDAAWVRSPAFLKSFDWAIARYKALQKCGGHCACCGRRPAECGPLNVDHIEPRKSRPDLALDVSNLQVICATCNRGKANWDTTDWREAA